jgi:parvulin-like peptidyl-prolyl isomerase
MKIRRVVIIAAVVFLAGISSWVGYEYYDDYRANTAAWRQVMIEVNGVPFTMEYFVKMLNITVNNYINTIVNAYLDLYMQMYNTTQEETIRLLTYNTISELSNNTNNITDMVISNVADGIIDAELLRQGAENLKITVTNAAIDAALKQYGLPNDSPYRDVVRASLLGEKLKEEYFGPAVNNTNTMEQAHIQVMLVESQEVADEVLAEVEADGNFTALIGQYSCNSSIQGDLGWLPEELMPNSLIADAAFNLTPPELSQAIYDERAIKEVGYWLIEVTDAQNETINALVMLLGSETEAEGVKAELAAGGNFSALAANLSQHESKPNGGKLDGLKRGDMGSAPFDEVAFNLTLNKISEPVRDTWVQTTGGYWLVWVMDRAEHELNETTKEQLIDKHLNDWRAAWAENSTIETYYLDANRISWALDKVLEEW